jgi:nucleoid-associated protein YgaU
MSRTDVRRRRLVVLATAAVVAGFWAGPVAHALGGAPPPVPVVSRTYVVRPGDTLWAIATRVAPGEDPRPLVDALARVNGLDAGRLVPGRTVVVPVGG